MRSGMAFADVLDETLAVYGTTEGPAVQPAAQPAARPAAASTYVRPLGFFAFGAVPQQPSTAGRLTGILAARAPTLCGAAAICSNKARRVGSASAVKASAFMSSYVSVRLR